MLLNRQRLAEDAKARAEFTMKYWKNTASAEAAGELAGPAEVNRVSDLQNGHP